MNLHIPQEDGARVEVMEVMSATRHIVSRKNNAPVIGSVQHTLLGMYVLTNTRIVDGIPTPNMIPTHLAMDLASRATHFSLEMWNDLMKRAHEFYPSDIMKIDDEHFKPRSLLINGKILASLAFPKNLSYSRTTKTNESFPTFIVHKGVILPHSGPVCKKIIGIGAPLIHVLYRVPYSPSIASEFISGVNAIGCSWIWTQGFSMGMIDCIPTNTVIIQDALQSALIECENVNSSKKTENEKEVEINSLLNKAMNVAPRLAKTGMHGGLDNALVVMKISGAKGNDVNNGQISGFVGQQNIDGARAPRKLNEGTRCLPHFECGDNSPAARGFVARSYTQGLSPTEMYFHSISGRRGVTDTHSKTADSGYISKKMNKKMEDFVQDRNGAIYDTNGNVVTFLYGGDGMNAKHLVNITFKNSSFPFFVDVHSLAKILNCDFELSGESFETSTKQKRVLTSQEIGELFELLKVGSYRTEVCDHASANIKVVLRACLETAEIYSELSGTFREYIQELFETSKSEHGESVGIIAGFSLGQPTTQMTLNTFQAAGVSAKDVTLGLPWLKELINASENQSRRNCRIVLRDRRIDEIIHREKCMTAIPDVDVNLKKTISDQKTLIVYKVAEEFLTVKLKDIITTITLKYLPDRDRRDNDGDGDPYNIIRYEEFTNFENLEIAKELGLFDPEFKPLGWVVCVDFDLEKCVGYGVTMEFIANEITNQSSDMNGEVKCFVSPNCDSHIDVFINFEKIPPYIRAHKEVPDHITSGHFYDEVDFKMVCARDIILEFVKDVQLEGVCGIDKVDISEEDSPITPGEKEWIVTTLGTNLRDILALRNIDFSRTISNDMYEVYRVLGIEASRNFLITEITKVLCFDGTYINPRHISLLVDAMTRRGSITSVTRDGIKGDASVLGRGMFEEPISNFTQSAVFGEKDPMNSMSAAIMMGTLANTGMKKSNVYEEDRLPARRNVYGKS